MLSTDAEGRTVYETKEVFYGLLSYIIGWLHAKSLTQCFESMAVALKQRAEEL